MSPLRQDPKPFAAHVAQAIETGRPAAGQPGAPRLLIDMRGIRKSYYVGQPNELEILHGIDLQVYEGEFIAIVGESGSGKSTLMNIIGVLDKPTAGAYTLDGIDIHAANDKELAAIRNRKIGFVFQTYNLIGRQSALKNVELPMLYAGVPGPERARRAADWLGRVGMGERMTHKPSELSGGQQQRVAIARAIAARPPIIMADEPTGNLDTRSGEDVMQILHELNAEGRTIVLITHDNDIARQATRAIRIIDGKVVSDTLASELQKHDV